MSAFLSPLWLEDVDGDTFIVCAPFHYRSDLLNGIVVVPTGTETDLASVPRLFWLFTPKSGKWNRAAVLHDAGYNSRLRTETGQRIRLVKPLSDKLFLEAMRLSGVNGVLARLMYRAVSAFGRTADA